MTSFDLPILGISVSQEAIPWIFFILCSVILVSVPWLNTVSLKKEQQSRRLQYFVNILLASIVVHHILMEAYYSSGVDIFLFSVSGFVCAFALGRMGEKMRVHPWPVLPWAMSLTIGLHGIFDGFALRLSTMPEATQPLTITRAMDTDSLPYLSAFLTPFSGIYATWGSLSLAVAVLLHRIPESLLIWRLTSKLISKKAAAITLATLGLSTFIGLVLSDEILSYIRPFFLKVSYMQVFIAGVILHATLETFIFKKDTCCRKPA